MASIFGVGIARINPVACFNRLCKVSKNHNVVQVALMTRVADQTSSQTNKPPPYPYWEKEWRGLDRYTDPMVYRFDDNTRLLVVDGPPAMGKTKVCEKIAAEFGLLYMPPPTHDQLYIDQYGCDFRTLDPYLPRIAKTFDLPRFLENPKDQRTALFQEHYFLMRLDQYMNAVLHILSTGQGVVLNRCVYSDIVFTEAMSKAGYLSTIVQNHYMTMRNVGLHPFPRPHAIIYLDAPVKVVQDKIKQRGRPEEVKSTLFSTKFLTDLEQAYKEKYLKYMSDHTHILAYDWSKEADLNGITDDINKLNLDDYSTDMLRDWVFNSREDAALLREFIDQERIDLYLNMLKACDALVTDDLFLSPDENYAEEKAIKEHFPSQRYTPGFNPKFGDKVLNKEEEKTLTFCRQTVGDYVNSDFVKPK
ncbi:NADH dehydrogenase (ubiquinone) subunit ND-42 [Lasioglossum baleicum]|uniref:NADH dehydrogenase (ubiquinone) subunit ND-42 n=1 Tax=Lasioglossum baleicum TaxID=434251 RepID=UPI003FCECC68